MTPSWWQTVVLVLAAFRLTRLVGWDDFPLAVKARGWAAGDREAVDHFLRCPFCLGWWISLAVYGAWLASGGAMYVLVPFAISGAVGLVAKNLDP